MTPPDLDLVDMDSMVTVKIAQAANRIMAQSAAMVRSVSELTVVEWRVMRRLANIGKPISVMQLADRVVIDKGQLSRTLKALTKKGMLTMEADEHDHRSRRIEVTPAGEALVERVEKVAIKRYENLVSGIDGSEYQTFIAVLETIMEAAESHDFSQANGFDRT